MRKKLFDRRACLNAILSLLIGSSLCTGCIKIPDEEVPITLSVSENSLNFTYSGGSQLFEVTSNDEWTVRKDSSWLTVTPSYGNNFKTVTVVTERNASSTSRDAIITVYSSVSGVSSKNIYVRQAGVPTAQVRFRKEGTYSIYTYMGVENSNEVLVASYYFGSGSGTSNYYSVPAGIYYPVYYNTSYGGWEYFYFSDGSGVGYDYFNAGNRYTIVLYYDNGYYSYTTYDGSY